MTFSKRLRVYRSPRGHVTASLVGGPSSLSVIQIMKPDTKSKLTDKPREWEEALDKLEVKAIKQLRELYKKEAQ